MSSRGRARPTAREWRGMRRKARVMADRARERRVQKRLARVMTAQRCAAEERAAHTIDMLSNWAFG